VKFIISIVGLTAKFIISKFKLKKWTVGLKGKFLVTTEFYWQYVSPISHFECLGSDLIWDGIGQGIKLKEPH
jgi:hypothetical protein